MVNLTCIYVHDPNISHYRITSSLKRPRDACSCLCPYNYSILRHNGAWLTFLFELNIKLTYTFCLLIKNMTFDWQSCVSFPSYNKRPRGLNANLSSIFHNSIESSFPFKHIYFSLCCLSGIYVKDALLHGSLENMLTNFSIYSFFWF